MVRKGNNYYAAPEVLENREYDSSIDMFALGVCLHHMSFKKWPYLYIEKDYNSPNYIY
jgi:serine/threonine protein kinase